MVLPKNIGEHVRQGDLLIRKITKIPSSVKTTLKADRVVLEGEITGHNHELVDGKVLLVNSGQDNQFDRREDAPHAFLELEKDTTLIHPEHGPIELKKGDYEVIRQREVRGKVLD